MWVKILFLVDTISTDPPEPPVTDTENKDSLDNLDQILNTDDMDRIEADVDRMLTQSLEQIDIKTVEDMFKGVQETTEQPSENQTPADSFQLPPVLGPNLPCSTGSSVEAGPSGIPGQGQGDGPAFAQQDSSSSQSPFGMSGGSVPYGSTDFPG